MCYTLMHVPNVHWILIEDSDQRTDLVTNVLRRCDVASTHLVIKRSLMFDMAFAKFWRGFEQRNLGLSWIRAQCGVGTQSLLTERVLKSEECNGVVYFADDDNKYDLRLFELVRVSHRPPSQTLVMQLLVTCSMECTLNFCTASDWALRSLE